MCGLRGSTKSYYSLHINADAVRDFYLKLAVAYASDTWNVVDLFDGLNGAAVQGYETTREVFAYARRAGAKIGPGKNWFGGGDLLHRNGGPSGTTTRGQWWHNGTGVRNHYVGLRFSVQDKNHYGWARLSTSAEGGHIVDIHLTGYAYESVPNKPIIAGHIKGSDVVRRSQASLGQLAQGVARH